MSLTQNIARAKMDYDEVFEAGKASGYETITITQDCTNIKQIYNIFDTLVSADDEMVLFVNNAYVGVPNSNTPNNGFLEGLWVAPKYYNGDSGAPWMRWRDGAYQTQSWIQPAYDAILPAGSTLRKVVIR